MRKLPILFLLLLLSKFTFADVSGEGCKIGEGFIYTQYLGSTPAYTGTPPIRYFNSNGPKIPFYWGYGQNLHRGYRCGYINVYPASSYYDQESGTNIPIEAENEFTYLGSQCVIAPTLGATPVATDSFVSYSYMKTNKCAVTPPENVPLDDYIGVILFASALTGAYFLRENGHLVHQYINRC